MGEEKRKDILKEVVWKHCSTHDIPYPAGGTCPECDKARKR
jgi:hypothetical protein